MELNICHLYPDLLNVYGDIGNILILKYRAEKRNINVNIKNISLGDYFDYNNYDIVFFGGGQDFEQSIVSEDLFKKRDLLKKYIECNKVFLSICGGYQLLGKYYETIDGEKIKGLNILDLYTKAGKDRFIGNTIILNEKTNEYYVGFENHSGKTYLGKNLTPLGKVIKGYGNNGEDNYEGCIYKNCYCTYFHGPFLSKNPEIADKLILKALLNKYKNNITLTPLDDYLELSAKKVILDT